MMREAQGGSREEFYSGLEVGRDLRGVAFNQWPRGDLNRARGVSDGTSCCLRCITRLRKASLGHNRGVPCGPMANFFSSHAVFLSGEGKDNKGGGGKVIIGGI